MPKSQIEALEKFVVRTIDHVEVKMPDEAEAFCKAGQIPYDDKEIKGDAKEWFETPSLETCNEQTRDSDHSSRET